MATADGTSSRMADLARDLRSEESAAQTLQHVVQAVVDLIEGCDSAGISLATTAGRIRTSACTGEVPVAADRLQQELGEGPCVDAAWHEEVVSATDLGFDTRWPLWAPRAVAELGVRSMVCVRLFTHDDRLGALNLFSHRRAAFSAEDLDEAMVYAAHAAVAITAAEQIEGLTTAVHNRTVLGQATGLLMAQYAVTAHQAFNLLRRLSSEQNRKVVVIAREVVEAHDGVVTAASKSDKSV
ncbi:GAF and ANTAR domain-containing protein [Nocardioides aurantiacus]|uniref:GAF domain-containing protein n=1 Tax=Nocardioides aurantiacus TaxID=86796 RepID=A0A3N2CWP2_9ACTN|nr:GAF and ANTAR domain-containing protein [Nocardioides aurantiacus]ROR91893.1 GAF domain-containing protein [Nocardioides aurantiacus]